MGQDKREEREEGLYSMKGLAQRDWDQEDEGEATTRGPRPSQDGVAGTEGSGSGSTDGTTRRPDIPGRQDTP